MRQVTERSSKMCTLFDAVDGGASEGKLQELLKHTASFVSDTDAAASSHAVLWDASPTHDSSLVWGRLLQVGHTLQLTLLPLVGKLGLLHFAA